MVVVSSSAEPLHGCRDSCPPRRRAGKDDIACPPGGRAEASRAPELQPASCPGPILCRPRRVRLQDGFASAGLGWLVAVCHAPPVGQSESPGVPQSPHPSFRSRPLRPAPSTVQGPPMLDFAAPANVGAPLTRIRHGARLLSHAPRTTWRQWKPPSRTLRTKMSPEADGRVLTTLV